MKHLLPSLAVALLLVGCMTEPTTDPYAFEDSDGAALYLETCESCHGYDGRGSDSGPDLYWRTQDMTVDEVADVVLFGEGLMDSIDLDEDEATAVASFLLGELLPEIP
jgi:mono/diheme cytochrome c family protein